MMADTATAARGTNITDTVIFKTKGGASLMTEKSHKFGCL
jgi:hypothetical protein